MSETRPFSWLKAIAHSIAAGLVFFLPPVLFSAAGAVNATKAGEFAGGFVVAGLILGWLWSWSRQRGSTTISHVLLAILVAMSAYEVFVLGAGAASRAKRPSGAALEARAPSSHQTAGGVVLCQQDIGVSLPLGDVSLSPAPDLGTILRQKDPSDAVARWAFRESSGDIVVLMASSGFNSEEGLREFLKGASGAATGRAEILHQSVEWNGGRGTILLSVRQGESGRLDMRCISAANGNLACLQTIGGTEDRLAALRDRLAFGSCP